MEKKSVSYPINQHPDTGLPESTFRERVRDILNLDWSTRDEKIFAELNRLKEVEAMYLGLCK